MSNSTLEFRHNNEDSIIVVGRPLVPGQRYSLNLNVHTNSLDVLGMLNRPYIINSFWERDLNLKSIPQLVSFLACQGRS